MKMRYIAFCAVLVLLSIAQAHPFRHHGGGGAGGILSTQLSGTTVQFAASAPYYVGTLTTNMSPATPTFNNLTSPTYTLVASGGGCSGGDTTHFSITSGDVYTNTIAAGTYTLCITAAATGFASLTTQFTVTEGHKLDAAVTYCPGNGGGSGTSGSPWHAACIQAAVNAAAAGDTVFLAGGNWALSTADSSQVSISTAINLVGVGSGNSFDVWGHVSNINGVDQCPTAGTSITCVYTTGTSYSYATAPHHAGTISFISPCNTDTVAHIFLDGSKSTDGGGTWGLLNFQNCNTITVNDVRHLAFSNSSISGEAQFYMFQSNSVAVNNSVFADPIHSGGTTYDNSQTFQANGESSGITLSNNIFYQGGFNPIFMSSMTFTGNQQYDYNDGVADTAIIPAFGFTGSPVGGPANVYCPQAGATGQCSGDLHASVTNSLFYAPNHFFGTGGGLNDPGTSGGVGDLSWTGNQIIASDAEISACETGACAPAVVVQATAASCTSGTITFTAANTTISAGNQFLTVGFSPQGYNNKWTAATANSSTITVTGVTCPGTETVLGSVSTNAVVGMTINTVVDTSCNESAASYSFFVTNNSLVGSTQAALRMTGGPTWGILCKLGNPFSGNYTAIPILVQGFNGQKNYLSSPSNQYLTNSATISPVQSNNFCAGGAGTVTGCATSGFTTPPTSSFAIGPLYYDFTNGAYAVPFTAISFTAQYGAVQWLASTSSTPPLASDTRWSGNTAFWSSTAPGTYPPSAANSWIPPIELAGVAHGNTVYLWVMDSNNNISTAASVLVP